MFWMLLSDRCTPGVGKGCSAEEQLPLWQHGTGKSQDSWPELGKGLFKPLGIVQKAIKLWGAGPGLVPAGGLACCWSARG